MPSTLATQAPKPTTPEPNKSQALFNPDLYGALGVKEFS
jgi:hypothetical protein